MQISFWGVLAAVLYITQIEIILWFPCLVRPQLILGIALYERCRQVRMSLEKS